MIQHKRWFLSLFLISILIFATAAAAFAKGPGPGDSHNGKCTGNPANRIGGC